MTSLKNGFEAGTIGQQVTVANSGSLAIPETFQSTANTKSDEFTGGRTDLTGWTLVFDDDFTTLAAEGSFLTTYNGVVDPHKWDAYPNDYLTTEAQNTGSGNHYETKNISVISGVSGATGNVMRMQLRRDPSDNKAWGAAPIPLFASNKTSAAQTYGRYEYRVKADAVAGWHLAWLLWPLSDDQGTITWPQSGETDFPEGDLNTGIQAYMHWYGGTSGSSQDAYEPSPIIPWNQWNKLVIEWKPNSCEFFINDVSIGHSTGSHVVPGPMRCVLQSETSTATVNATANVYVDYVSIWSYTP